MADVTSSVPNPSTSLAAERTRLAYERTLMAWVRTATSLITFGFTIYKFFDFLRERGTTIRPDRVLGPREFAMIMIGIGLVALALATVQHVQETRALRREYQKVPISLATVLAALVSVLGIMSFLAVLFRQ